MWEFQFGVYHYSYVNSMKNAVLEAKNCLKFIGDKKFELPVFLDLEENLIKAFGKEQITNFAIAFCKEIEKAGFKAGVYANLDWFTNYIDVNKLIEKGFKIWLAQWNDKITAPFSPNYWQYTSKGQVHGIEGHVDLDLCFDEISETVQTVENPVEKSKFEKGKTYTTQVDLNVRTGAGTNYSIKKYQDLTKDGKNHAYKQNYACLKKGTRVTVLDIIKLGNDIWLRIPSGFIAGFYQNKDYVK